MRNVRADMGLSSTIYLAYASCFCTIARSPPPKMVLILFILFLSLPVILLVYLGGYPAYSLSLLLTLSFV